MTGFPSRPEVGEMLRTADRKLAMLEVTQEVAAKDIAAAEQIVQACKDYLAMDGVM